MRNLTFQQLKKHKILVLGMAKSCFAACRLLDKSGCDFQVFDDDSKVRNEIRSKSNYKLYEDNFDYDVAVIAPSVQTRHPLLLKEGIRIITETDLAYLYILFRNTEHPFFIGITGTNGKTTTVTMLTHILTNMGQHCVCAGNIGTPLSAVADEIDGQTVVVLELSSFQLKNTSALRLNVGAITNIAQNHLDVHENFEDYIASKLKIVEIATKLVFNYDNKHLNALRGYAVSDKTKPQDGVYIDCDYLRSYRQGREINRALKPTTYNEAAIFDLAIACACAELCDLPIHLSVQSVNSYAFMSHRLQLVAEKKGVLFFDDSKSTNIHSTLSAINNVEAPIVLIVGGRDKHLDYNELIDGLDDRTKLVCCVGENSTTIDECAKSRGFDRIEVFDSLILALKAAVAVDGVRSILFSPTAASFDSYISYAERGRHFEQLVATL